MLELGVIGLQARTGSDVGYSGSELGRLVNLPAAAAERILIQRSPDGDPLRYSWVVPSGTFVNGTSNTDVTIQVTFPGAAPYTVTVTVNDGQGGTDTASITITTSEGLEQ